MALALLTLKNHSCNSGDLKHEKEGKRCNNPSWSLSLSFHVPHIKVCGFYVVRFCNLTSIFELYVPILVLKNGGYLKDVCYNKNYRLCAQHMGTNLDSIINKSSMTSMITR